MCDANASIGFGHASRCANIAKYLLKSSQNIKIGFMGNYVLEVKKRIIDILGSIEFLSENKKFNASCIIIDALGDNNDPDILPTAKFDYARKYSKNLIFLSSGSVIKDLPKDMICIGYHPSGVHSLSPNIYWGLKYAPTILSEKKNCVKRDYSSALLALGGVNNITVFDSVVDALKEIKTIKEVNILISPVNHNINFEYDKKSSYFKTHYNLKSISPLLYKAGLVIASFGNLSYEALAHGAPLCLVGTKTFQAQYGEFLVKERLAYNAGLIDKYDTKNILFAINKTINNAKILSMNGKGIMRQAAIIKQYI
jgi:spore coat polysaccharide biosynthesis predicted glycosyltransferase SpsG